MPLDPHLERLVQAYLDGSLTEAETVALSAHLRDDSAAADYFAAATRFEALLESHLVEAQRTREWSADAPAVPARTRRRRLVGACVVAAVALLAFGLANRPARGPIELSPAAHRIISGQVLVDGIEAATFLDGARLEVVGSTAAMLRLADGAEVELAPTTTAMVRLGSDGAVVRLDQGNGKFRSGDDHASLRVDTPLGAVSGHEAEFAIDLQATDHVESTAMNFNVPALLVVAALGGQVEVQEADRKVEVPAGESRAFSQEKKPMFSGRVVAVSSDGRQLTLEGKGAKKGAPPRREVRITEQTELAYYGVARDGARPTVGYMALATLDQTAPDRAIAIEFGEKEPTVSGFVSSVGDDGRTLTLEVYRKGAKPEQRVIALGDRTRTRYRGIAEENAKPTTGYHASAWLAQESDRVAVEVWFVYKTKGTAPTNPERKPKGAPKSSKAAPVRGVEPKAK